MKAAGQFARFVVAGGASLVVDLAVLQVLLLAGVPQEMAVAAAFVVGIVVNLLMHKYFTFQDSRHLHASQAMRYLAVVALNLALTEAIVWLATSGAGMGVFTGKLLSLPVVTAIGFVLARKWVFVPRS